MPTILVVEDEPRIRQFVVINLRVRGYQVLESGSAEDTLAMLKQQLQQEQPPAAIILDLKLPGMSGLEMLQALQNTPAGQIPVIMMTASPLQLDPEEASQRQIVARLVKPVGTEELLATISQVVH
ncbi:MAG: response regulator [Anaerolineae bacterium]